MPLIKGKSQKSFVKNLKTEMEHGKPQKQSLAIAYAMKRKAQKKKMADGGEMTSDSPSLPGADDFQSGMRKATHYAEGGKVCEHCGGGMMAEGGEMESGYHDLPQDVRELNEMAEHEDDKDLNQHSVNMHAETSIPEEDLVDRIMDKKSKNFSSEDRLAKGGYIEGDEMYPHAKDKMFDVTNKYSEGGKVANSDEIEAGFDPNEFDDLHLRDNLESSYGEDDNAGDDLDNKQEDKDRADLVDRIMLRSFKQKIPRGYPGR